MEPTSTPPSPRLADTARAPHAAIAVNRRAHPERGRQRRPASRSVGEPSRRDRLRGHLRRRLRRRHAARRRARRSRVLARPSPDPPARGAATGGLGGAVVEGMPWPARTGSASWTPTFSTRRKSSSRCWRGGRGRRRPRRRQPLLRRRGHRQLQPPADVAVQVLVVAARALLPQPPAQGDRPAERLLPRPAGRPWTWTALRPKGFKILLEILVRTPGSSRRPRCRSSSASATPARPRPRSGRACAISPALAPAVRRVLRALRPLRGRRRTGLAVNTGSSRVFADVARRATTSRPRSSPPRARRCGTSASRSSGCSRPPAPPERGTRRLAMFFAVNNAARSSAGAAAVRCSRGARDEPARPNVLTSRLALFVDPLTRLPTCGSGQGRTLVAEAHRLTATTSTGSSLSRPRCALPELERFRVAGSAGAIRRSGCASDGYLPGAADKVAAACPGGGQRQRQRQRPLRAAPLRRGLRAARLRRRHRGRRADRGARLAPASARPTFSTRTWSSRSCAGPWSARATRWSTPPASPTASTRS